MEWTNGTVESEKEKYIKEKKEKKSTHRVRSYPETRSVEALWSDRQRAWCKGEGEKGGLERGGGKRERGGRERERERRRESRQKRINDDKNESCLI